MACCPAGSGSTGSYGALLLAARLGAERVAAVAASSPAIWQRFADAEPGAFDDAADFARNDLLSRVDALRTIPLRIDCGEDDPFADGARRLRAAFHPAPEGGIAGGCHDGAFWARAAGPELAFVGRHLLA